MFPSGSDFKAAIAVLIVLVAYGFVRQAVPNLPAA